MKLSRDLTLVTWSKGNVVLRMETSHCKSVLYLVWCSWVCRWRYNVFNLSRDVTWPPHWEIMRIYGSELLVLCHYANKPCGHNHCEGLFNNYVTHRGWWKTSDGKQKGWVVLDEKPQCHGKKNHKAFFLYYCDEIGISLIQNMNGKLTCINGHNIFAIIRTYLLS